LKSIHEHFGDLMRAYEAHDYRRGLRVARDAHAECPASHEKTFFWLACMHSLLGNQADAVEALEAGLEEGAWWAPKTLDEEHDLDPIRGAARFLEVRSECERRFRGAREESNPECLAIRPPSGVRPVGVLMAIHWRGDNSIDFLARWRPSTDRRGWILLAPQSSQPCGNGIYCWDDAERGRAELGSHWDGFFATEGVRFERRIIAGASQGGRLAFELAQQKGVPYLCMIPSFPKGYRPSPGPDGSFTRGVFLLGERDPANSRSWSVIEELETLGASVETRSMKGTAHGFPPDFSACLDGILDELS